MVRNSPNASVHNIVLPEKKAGVRRIWLQAVSVGEVLAIDPVIEKLTVDGDVEVYLTTTTSTGFQLASERFRQPRGRGWIFSDRLVVVLSSGVARRSRPIW